LIVLITLIFLCFPTETFVQADISEISDSEYREISLEETKSLLVGIIVNRNILIPKQVDLTMTLSEKELEERIMSGNSKIKFFNILGNLVFEKSIDIDFKVHDEWDISNEEESNQGLALFVMPFHINYETVQIYYNGEKIFEDRVKNHLYNTLVVDGGLEEVKINYDSNNSKTPNP